MVKVEMTPSGIVALACAVVNFAGAGLDVTSAVRSGEVIAFLTAATADGPSTSRPSTAGTTSKVPCCHKRRRGRRP